MICNQRVKKRIELRTHEQLLVAEHRGGTDPDRFEHSRTRRTHEVPFIAGRSHFTRKKHKVSCPGFLPKRSRCNIHAAITMRTPPFMEYNLTLLIVVWCKLTHHPSLNIVSHFSLLCDVNWHTTLHWINFIGNSEDCFPTSFDHVCVCVNIYIYIPYARKASLYISLRIQPICT